MGNVDISDSGRRLRRSLQAHFNTVGVLAGAGVLVLGLLTAPPDTDVARTEVRTVHIAAFAHPLPSTIALPAKIADRGEGVSLVGQALTPNSFDFPNGMLDSPTIGALIARVKDLQTGIGTASAAEIAAAVTQVARGVAGASLFVAGVVVFIIIASPVLLPSAAAYHVKSFISRLTDSLPVVPAVATAATAAVATGSTHPLRFARDNVAISDATDSPKLGAVASVRARVKQASKSDGSSGQPVSDRMRKTPVRDAVGKARAHLEKAVDRLPRRVKQGTH